MGRRRRSEPSVYTGSDGCGCGLFALAVVVVVLAAVSLIVTIGVLT